MKSLLLILLFIGSAAKADDSLPVTVIKNVTDVRIEFLDPTNDAELARGPGFFHITTEIGLVLEGSPELAQKDLDNRHFGSITILGKPGAPECLDPADKERCVLAHVPIVISFSSYGFNFISGLDLQDAVSLYRTDGLSLDQLLGNYNGGQFGIATSVGGKENVVVNNSGVVLWQDSLLNAMGFTLALSVVTIDVPSSLKIPRYFDPSYLDILKSYKIEFAK